MPDRITLSRAKGYRRPEGTIQVDRATIFGNPWQVGDPGIWWMPRLDGKAGWEGVSLGWQWTVDQAAVVDLYGTWLRSGHIPPMPDQLTARGRATLREAMDARRTLILQHLPLLKGHPLGCRCAQGTPCHADVLIELANGGQG